MAKSIIKLIIFDLWDTLAYKKKPYGKMSYLKKITKSKLSKDKFTAIFEKSIQTKVWKSKYAAYKNFCRDIGFPISKENIELLIKIRGKAETTSKLFNFTLPMLKKLRRQGYKTGLLSNTSVFAARQVKKRTNLLKFIDYPLFSFQAKTIKPDPIIFRKILKFAKVKPSEALMVGDTFNRDVLPPRKLGMKAIHYKNYVQLKREFKKYGIKI